MAVILGIDLGTQSVKALIMEQDGAGLDTQSEEYAIDIPKVGYAEQSPEEWWQATITVLRRLKSRNAKLFGAISAIGFSGQMHGMVALDENNMPVLPAINWLDQRSKVQVEEINKRVPFEDIAATAHNRVFTGFALPTALWIKQERPEEFARISSIVQPKDYIRMRLTGEVGCDMSDASSTTAFDISKRQWNYPLLEKLGLPADIYPECREATDIAGSVTREAAEQTGLRPGIPVVYGGGDMPVSMIGSGIIQPGAVTCNIGTGGQVATFVRTDTFDPKMRVHTFCNVIEKAYVIFGATLSSGMSMKWLKNNVLRAGSYEQMSADAGEIPPGSEGLLYLPYLSGERTPWMDHNAKGMFYGLRLKHDHRHFSRAVMEGVTFALRNSLDILTEMGVGCERVTASGGGAKSPVWLQIQADIFNKPVQVIDVSEQACLGACVLAGLGTGIYGSAAEACAKFVRYQDRIYIPDAKRAEQYEQFYGLFNRLYPANAELFNEFPD